MVAEALSRRWPIITNKGEPLMRFMLFMIPNIADKDWMPKPEDVARMTKFNETLRKAGALLSLDGLHSSTNGARVSFPGGKPTVTEGPFNSDGKGVIGGYWMIEAKSMDEAIEWAKRVPAGDGPVIEVRQVFEMSDFPPEVQKAAKG
jgi:hypothetical protein